MSEALAQLEADGARLYGRHWAEVYAHLKMRAEVLDQPIEQVVRWAIEHAKAGRRKAVIADTKASPEQLAAEREFAERVQAALAEYRGAELTPLVVSRIRRAVGVLAGTAYPHAPAHEVARVVTEEVTAVGPRLVIRCPRIVARLWRYERGPDS